MKDFIIETERLYLRPLRRKNIELWLEDSLLLENELNCNYQNFELMGGFKKAVQERYPSLLKDEENYFYYSCWFLIQKKDWGVIGGADFNGSPNELGEIELRFALDEKFEHMGYMTEVLHAMCNWSFQQKDVFSVVVKGVQANYRMERLLKRCCFEPYCRKEVVWWRREKD